MASLLKDVIIILSVVIYCHPPEIKTAQEKLYLNTISISTIILPLSILFLKTTGIVSWPMKRLGQFKL